MAKQTIKHSNVYYIYNKKSSFEAVEKATGCKNSYGLDLFRHKGDVFEGRTGLKYIDEADLPNLDSKIESLGGVEKFNALVEDRLKKIGESPRYTRPDERKKDIFPPNPAKENIVFAKDSYGKKHYFFRFNYEGFELFTLNREKDYFRQVFVQCEGYMLGIDQHHRLEEIKKWLESLENGVKHEVEKRFNASLADPGRWADIGYANILRRVDEANAHNTPIREARNREYQLRNEERKANRIAEEQAAKTEYEQAIKAAENKILNNQTISNANIQSKSLIMQLFREHEISIPLKTQGWIIKALHSIEFDEQRQRWSYHYFKGHKDSTVFSDYLQLLVSAIQTKQQKEDAKLPIESEAP